MVEEANMKTANALLTSVRRAEADGVTNPNATVQFLDTGHFALETHVWETALAMRDFLDKYQSTKPNEFLSAQSI
jgi:hypothetical protein